MFSKHFTHSFSRIFLDVLLHKSLNTYPLHLIALIGSWFILIWEIFRRLAILLWILHSLMLWLLNGLPTPQPKTSRDCRHQCLSPSQMWSGMRSKAPTFTFQWGYISSHILSPVGSLGPRYVLKLLFSEKTQNC